MVDLPTVAARIRHVRLRLALDRNEDMSKAEFARLVSEQLKRKPPYDNSAVTRWEQGAVPDNETLGAIAALDPERRGPAWVAWGIPVSGEVRGDESPPADPAKPVPRLLPRPDVAAPKKGRGTA